jgi:hypothetical protein
MRAQVMEALERLNALDATLAETFSNEIAAHTP